MMNQVRRYLVQIISDDCFDYGDAEEFEVQPNYKIEQLAKEVVRDVHYNNR